MLDSAECTDWLSSSQQQIWFDRFKTADSNGLKFVQFQEFLRATIYKYFATFPESHVPASVTSNKQEPHNTIESPQLNVCSFSQQQEMQIFKIFDAKNDHLIDRDEFDDLCRNWLHKTYRPSCALIVVDVQNDFIDGSLALINGPAGEDGAEVVPVINSLLDNCNFQTIVYTQDWHPAEHIGFHANLHLRKYQVNKGPATNCLMTNSTSSTGSSSDELDGSTSDKGNSNETNNDKTSADRFKLKKLVTDVQVYDTVLFDEGQMEQKLWPVHCVQNSWGAQLHPKLKIVPNAFRVYKGTLANVDAYSAFWDNKRLNETGLRQELAARKVDDLFFCGLALDYCVAASAIDAAKSGFITFVIEDACRGIDRQEMERRKEEMSACGILIVKSCYISNYLMQVGGTHIEQQEQKQDLLGSGTLKEKQMSTRSKSSSPVMSLDSNSNGNKGNLEKFDRNLIMGVCFRRALLRVSHK